LGHARSNLKRLQEANARKLQSVRDLNIDLITRSGIIGIRRSELRYGVVRKLDGFGAKIESGRRTYKKSDVIRFEDIGNARDHDRGRGVS